MRPMKFVGSLDSRTMAWSREFAKGVCNNPPTEATSPKNGGPSRVGLTAPTAELPSWRLRRNETLRTEAGEVQRNRVEQGAPQTAQDVRNPFPKRESAETQKLLVFCLAADRKKGEGGGFLFPNPGKGEKVFGPVSNGPNPTETSKGGPGEVSFFFCRVRVPGSLARGWDAVFVKHRVSCGVRWGPLLALKIRGSSVNFCARAVPYPQRSPVNSL
ncbi:hypothetical protein JTE90_004705 [Oedothorax gibbosus]|uniref:Uncharacterized protein n=1 Tax=Oedothorax gibbosus TaxID=931172 RepID=A0AAV6TJG1_9ARAC|nr:hypothetical protein JTE90_004705 [Oedothorax gibbosus]